MVSGLITKIQTGGEAVSQLLFKIGEISKPMPNTEVRMFSGAF